jgi:hypothetical protein
MTHQFYIVTMRLYGTNEEALTIITTADTFESAAEKARGWAQEHPGVVCWIIQRLRRVACDQLRETDV